MATRRSSSMECATRTMRSGGIAIVALFCILLMIAVACVPAYGLVTPVVIESRVTGGAQNGLFTLNGPATTGGKSSAAPLASWIGGSLTGTGSYQAGQSTPSKTGDWAFTPAAGKGGYYNVYCTWPNNTQASADTNPVWTVQNAGADVVVNTLVQTNLNGNVWNLLATGAKYDAGVAKNVHLATVATNAAGKRTYWDSVAFEPCVPTAPTPTAPADGAVNVPSTGIGNDLTWTAGNYNYRYDVYVSSVQADVTSKAGSAKVATDLSTTTFDGDGASLSAGTTYYWRVVAKNVDQTADGVVRSFTAGGFTVTVNPASWTAQNSVTVTFDASVVMASINRYEVAVDGGGYSVQTSPYTMDVSGLSDGTHAVHVKAISDTDDEIQKDATLYLDKAGPADFVPTATPATYTHAASVSIAFATTDAASGMNHYELALDGGGYTTRTSPYSLNVSAEADGDHTVHVKAIDNVGNSTTKDVTIHLDKTAPVAFTPTCNPVSWTNTNSADITWATTDATSGIDYYTVNVDAGGPVTATSPYTLNTTALSNGVHTVNVIAVDAAVNVCPASVSLYIDRAAPNVSLVHSDDYLSAGPIPVDYVASDPQSGIKKVSLWYRKGVGGVWTDSGLSSTQASDTFSFAGTTGDDTYYFGLVLEDNVGNTAGSNVGAGACQTVLDHIAAEYTSIVATPGVAKPNTEVTITFASSEPLTSNPIVTVNSNVAAYASKNGLNYTYKYTIADADAEGYADIYIEGTDLSGNNSFTDDLTQLLIDKTAPEDFTPTANPAGYTCGNSIDISFSTTDSISAIDHYEVAVDGGGFTAKTSPYTLSTSGLSDGTHTVHVKAFDLAGNTLTKDVTIYFDKTAPADFTPTANPASWTSAASVSISFATTDATAGIAHYEVALDGGGYSTKASPYALDVSAVADGTHTVHVKAIDVAGNELIKDVSIYIDKGAPADFTPTANPASWTKADTISIGFSTTDSSSGIDHYELAVDGGGYTTQTSPYSLSTTGLSDGTHTVHVKALDVAGNQLTKDVTVYTDKGAPNDFTPAANPASWTKDDTISITFSATDGGSAIDHYELAVDGGGYTAQTSPYALDVSAATDGTHTVHVKAFDLAGNTLTKDVVVYVDKTAPADFTPTANPASWTRAASVAISFATTDATAGIAHYEVALDGGAYTTQSSPYALDVSAVTDDTHTVHVKAIDNAGNELIKDVTIYTDKSVPDDFTPTANPASWTRAASISISFATTSTSGIDHYEVAVDGGGYTTQASPYALSTAGLTDGTHTVHVKAICVTGGSLVKDVTIYIDKSAPVDFTPAANPASWTSANTVDVSFSTTDAISDVDHYEVSVDSGPFATQTSPCSVNASGLTDGTHTVHVKAIDLAGNQLTKNVTIYIDRSDPADFTATANPSGWTSGASVSISFATTDATAGINHYEVALDGGPYATHTSPYALDVSSVADGTHTVHVKAIDNAGNDLVKDVTVRLDKTNPAAFTPTANATSWTKASSVSISFATTDATSGIASYQVALDGGGYTTRTSPYALDVSSVADGTHTVHVKAIDNAGNSLVRDVTISLDKTAPADFTPTANPAGWTRAGSVAISFAATDALAGVDHYEVAVDGGTYTTRTSPYTLDVSAITDGTHTVHVKAVDDCGNQRIKDVTISLDKTGPSAFTPASNPPTWCNQPGAGTAQITWSTSDANSGVDHYEVALGNGPYTRRTSPYSINAEGMTPGLYTLHVKAYDVAGNFTIGDLAVRVTSDTTPPSASLTFSDPNPSLGREFDYVFWKNWMGVTTAAQNTYNINWTAADSQSGVGHVYIECRPNASATWTLVASSTADHGTAAFDVSARPQSDSYQIRIRALDAANNQTVVVYDHFGLYDAAKLMPTAKIVSPPNGSWLFMGMTATIKVQETMPVFKDPRVADKAYKADDLDWWFAGHNLTATPQLRAYKRRSDGRPIALDKVLLASVSRSAPQAIANADATQASQYLSYVVVNTWPTTYALKQGIVNTADVFQVEMKYSDVVSVGNVRQPDKPNRAGQILPTVTQEPLIGILKQYEFSRFWVR